MASASLSRPDPSGGRRLPELDAVRGLASLTVVLMHFHDMWMPNDPAQLTVWKRAVLLLLKPFYAGSESVILFFVLSGLVLALPYLRGRQQGYARYLVRRVIRIYGPYLAALVLSVGGAAIWHGHAYHGNWAVPFWAAPVSLRLVAAHVLFLGVYNSAQYNFVIWSLVQEMRVSIIFPFLFALVAYLGRGRALLLGAGLSGVALWLLPQALEMTARYSLVVTLHYIAFFIVGILLASQLNRVEAWWLGSARGARWLLGVASFITFGYGSSMVRVALRHAGNGPMASATSGLIFANWASLFGACGLIVVALHANPVQRLLQTRPARGLGHISYSLYLVHPVVLLALTFSLRDRVSMWVQLPMYLAAALLLAWMFCKVVEEPCIRWSRSV